MAEKEQELKEFTYAEVAKHNVKSDIRLVIHDNVYNPTVFIDEHPGGEEVMMDMAGQDATDAFEDVGHSDEAREILATLRVGTLKRMEGDPKPSSTAHSQNFYDPSKFSSNTGLGIGLYLFLLVGGAAVYYGYEYLQQQQQKA